MQKLLQLTVLRKQQTASDIQNVPTLMVHN